MARLLDCLRNSLSSGCGFIMPTIFVRAAQLATLALCVMVAGCGGGDGGGTTNTPQPQTSPSPNTPSDNTVPTIQGKPITAVVVGQSYSFQPTANDPDGDAVSFSISNLPGWASFDNKTGRLSGKPTAADVGSYADIRISVSDGKASASLAAFSVVVSATGSGSATLSWMPPVQNTDGTSLTDLDGYQILFGRSPDELAQTIAIDNPSINTYVVEDLASGAWYFAVVAVNAKGIASSPSNVVTKTIG
jgi:hypothetical protein